jgi:nucleoside-diphosphate-sugar epimerase
MTIQSANRALIIGCGDLGLAVAKQLVDAGIETIGVRRTLQSVSEIEMVQADVSQSETLRGLKEIRPEFLIYCVAAHAQSDQAYHSAYVEGLRNVLETQRHNQNLRHVFFVSSTRVYGQAMDDLLDEATEAIPADFGGERLLEAEGLLNSLHCGSTALRLSGIYGPGRLRMINLAKQPTSWPSQNSWTNRIHRDDAAAFIVYLVKQVMAGLKLEACYIVTDAKPVAQYEVLYWIAAKVGIKAPSRVPSIVGGKRLSNRKMLATGFKLEYPDYQAGYASLLSNTYTK